MTHDVPPAPVGTVRPVMTWVPSADLTALDVAVAWHDALTDGRAGSSCLWTTRPLDRPVEHPAVDRLCWHVVDLPARIDRHLPVGDRRLPWSPWGWKSGPNRQFFTMLDRLAVEHDDDWVLLVEPDTYPIGDDVRGRVGDVIARHPTAWVIGGLPHPWTRPGLARTLWHHLNGAALYRVADPDFARFRATVWIPSLLSRIRSEPAYAFDCITDPAEQDVLSDPLAAAWRRDEDRFVATAGIVNASTLVVSPDRVGPLLAEVTAAVEEEGTAPWMLHAKGRPVVDLRRAAEPAGGSRS